MTGLAGNGYAARFGRVDVLTMASLLRVKLPSGPFDQLDNFAHFHHACHLATRLANVNFLSSCRGLQPSLLFAQYRSAPSE